MINVEKVMYMIKKNTIVGSKSDMQKVESNFLLIHELIWQRKVLYILTVALSFILMTLFILTVFVGKTYLNQHPYFLHDIDKKINLEKNILSIVLKDKDANPIIDKIDITLRLYSDSSKQKLILEQRCVGENALVPNYLGELQISIGNQCSFSRNTLSEGDDIDSFYLTLQIGSDSEVPY